MHSLRSIAHLTLACLVGAIGLCIAAACSDDLTTVGASVSPASDGISIKSAIFEVPLQTAYRDSVYVRTGYPLLGNITDPDFGQVKAGYLAQFYSSTELTLDAYNAGDSCIFDILRTSAPRDLGYDWPDYHYRPWDSIVGNQIDSMTIRVYYQAYYGDSLTPMQLSIYALNPEVDFAREPESAFYSNNDFAQYYDRSHLLGRKAFTAANRELSDSVRRLSDYTPYVEVKLSDSLKDVFYQKLVEAQVARDVKNPHHTECEDVFSDLSKLRRSLLSGVCVEPTYGDGCMVKVYYTAIYFFFRSYHRYDVDGTYLRDAEDSKDSTYVTSHVKYLAVTPDVIQMSGYTLDDPARARRMVEADTSYITSPLGYYTTIDLPVGRIIGQMMDDPQRTPGDSTYFLNSANFYLMCYKPKGTLISASAAPTMLMVEEAQMTRFFEEGHLPDSETSCYATFVNDSVPNGHYNNPREGLYYYSFGNISSVIMGLAEAHGWDKQADTPIADDYTVRMAVIPVDITTSTSGSNVLSVSNYILPTAAKVKRDPSLQVVRMLYTLEGDARRL